MYCINPCFKTNVERNKNKKKQVDPCANEPASFTKLTNHQKYNALFHLQPNLCSQRYVRCSASQSGLFTKSTHVFVLTEVFLQQTGRVCVCISLFESHILQCNIVDLRISSK